jgi:hypothetical protein
MSFEVKQLELKDLEEVRATTHRKTTAYVSLT